MKNNKEIAHKIIQIIKPMIIMFVLGLCYLFVFKAFGIGIPCVSRSITGYECPGCGMTRAIVEMSRLNFKGAYDYNALSITVFPLCCIYLIYRWIKANIDGHEGFYIWEYVLIVITLIIVLAYGIFRNL